MIVLSFHYGSLSAPCSCPCHGLGRHSPASKRRNHQFPPELPSIHGGSELPGTMLSCVSSSTSSSSTDRPLFNDSAYSRDYKGDYQISLPRLRSSRQCSGNKRAAPGCYSDATYRARRQDPRRISKSQAMNNGLCHELSSESSQRGS
jgi:hypothetical protein